MLIDDNTKVLVQGITGSQGSFHTRKMLDYGTDIVAGVTPGKGGKDVHDIPVYDSVDEATAHHDIDWSIGFVPPRFAKEAADEALQNDLNTCIITENIPVHDSIDIVQQARKNDLHVIGPNCPGLIRPGACKLGIMPGQIFTPGNIGVVSRSGTLTYEIVEQLTRNGLGQSLAVGIGGDPVIGLDFLDILKLFDKDSQTKKIVLVGEIGGDLEERAAELIAADISTPVVGYIAGKSAPEGKKMGHAGAIIHGEKGTAASKEQALEDAGVTVADLPSDIPDLLNPP